MKLLKVIALGSALTAGMVMAQTAPAAAGAADKAKTAAAKTVAPAPAPPTDAEIADAKAKGLVWVNTSTKKYHSADAATYGKTKRGKFMTEADAKASGAVAAQEPKAGAKKADKKS